MVLLAFQMSRSCLIGSFNMLGVRTTPMCISLSLLPVFTIGNDASVEMVERLELSIVVPEDIALDEPRQPGPNVV
jgi:hypothetical protein